MGQGRKLGWLLEETGFRGRQNKSRWCSGGESQICGSLSSACSIHSPSIHSRPEESSQAASWNQIRGRDLGKALLCPRPGITCSLSARHWVTQGSLLAPHTVLQGGCILPIL